MEQPSFKFKIAKITIKIEIRIFLWILLKL